MAFATFSVSQNVSTKRSVVKYFAPVKVSSVLPLCQENQFPVKGDLTKFYPLVRRTLSSLILIGAKRIFQASCLHHLKRMKRYCKTHFWEEMQSRMLLLDDTVGLILGAVLTFKNHLENKINKGNRITCSIKKLSVIPSRNG